MASDSFAIALLAFVACVAVMQIISHYNAITNVFSILFGIVYGLLVVWLLNGLSVSSETATVVAVFVGLIVAGAHIQGLQYVNDLDK
jgi:glucan phosphoethanolaminetransferase (alkaline phosphatase superfamily)